MSRDFADIVEGFIEEKRAIGFTYAKAARMLQEVIRLHGQMGCDGSSLSKGIVEAYTEKRMNESESTRLNRVSIIRGLGEYMARMGYNAYIAPRKQGWVKRESYQPYIFTKDEIRSLLRAAETVGPETSVTHRRQFILVLWLLYSTGMRVGEVCALKKSDIDLREGQLIIRHAKNDKDRRVPLCPSVFNRLKAYWDMMSLERYWGRSTFLFAQPGDITISESSIYWFFRKCLWTVGISHGGRGKGPRIHDLRFTFSCHKLRQWVEEGADINTLMPYLATYLGHADTRCTEYYLKLTADLYPSITAMVEENCSWMVPEVLTYEEP